MQALALFSTISFARLPSANSTKLSPGSKFWSKSINFDLSCLVVPQSTNKLLLSKTISYPKAKK